MFAKTIIDSDAFLDMPLSTQCLYFHLSMRADDDGFINNPKKIQRMTGCGDDDLKLLIAKQFIIPFESGIVVIKHWKIHNYIRSDRYKETMHHDEKAMLTTKDNKEYEIGLPLGIPNDDQMDTQVRIGKDSLGKESIDKEKKKEGKKERKKGYDEILSEIEDESLRETYLEYIKMRKLIKSPMTDKALTMLTSKVEKLAPGNIAMQKEMLETAILNNWKSVYPPKNQSTGNNQASKQAISNPFLRAAMQMGDE